MAYPSPRRLQLRRGNASAVSSYLGYAGELVVDTTNWTLYVHDGVTVGGRAATVNTASITGNINSILNGTATFGNLIPSANVTYSLGNVTHQWADLYVSNNTIYVGGVPLSIDNTGNLTINGNTIPTLAYVNAEVANVTVDLSSYALNANVTAANVGMQGYVDRANTIQTQQITAANLGIISYVNQQISNLIGGAPGILDTLGEIAASINDDANVYASLVASIGSSNVGLKGYVDQANTIQNEQLTQANVGIIGYINQAITIQSAQITAANVGMKGYVDASIGGIAPAYSNANVASYLPTYSGNISANISKAGYTWTFGTTGAMTTAGPVVFPNTGEVRPSSTAYDAALLGWEAIRGGEIQAAVDNELVTAEGWPMVNWHPTSTTAQGYIDFLLTAWNTQQDPESPPLIITPAISSAFYQAMRASLISIRDSYNNTNSGVSIAAGYSYVWNFGNTGSLSLPTSGDINFDGGDIIQSPGEPLKIVVQDPTSDINSLDLIVDDGNEAVQTRVLLDREQIRFDVDLQGSNHVWTFGNTGTLTIPSQISATSGQALRLFTTDAEIHLMKNPTTDIGVGLQTSGNDVEITTSDNYWRFGEGGNLTFPDDTVQITAWTGTVDYANVTNSYSNVQTAAYLTTNNYLTSATANLSLYAWNGNASGGGTSYSNVNVAAYLSTATINTTGNITAQNLIGNISITGNVTGTSANVTLQAGAYTSVFDNQGNVTLPTAYVAGNVTANYIFGNGAFLTGVVTSGGGDYSNIQVATYLPTYDGTVSASLVNTSGNILSTGLSAFGNTRIGRTGAVSGQFHTVVGNITQTSSGGAVYINTTGNVLAAAVVAGAVTSTGTVAVNAATGITTNQATFLLANANATTINIGGAATTIRMGTNTSNVFVGRAIGNATRELLLRAQGTWNTAISIDSNGGFNSPPYTNQLVIGGSGTGMTANYNATGGYLTSVTIYNPGTGYQNGDVLSVPGGIAGNTFTLTNYSSTLTGNSAAAYTFGIEGNLTVPGNVTARNFIGNGALLTGIVAGSDYSNVQVATYLPTYTGVVTASNVAVAGNVTAQYLFGNGSQLTGLPATYSNVQVATYLPTYTGNIANVRLSSSGVLTFPDGSQQTTAAFGGGSNYGNANVAAYLPTYTGTTGITQVGTLATLNVTGNTTVGNLVGTEANTRIIANTYVTTFDIYGNVSFPGNVIAPTFVGSGSLLSGVATKTTGSWTVTAGTNNYSFTVPANNSYQLWVRGNIPNGIIVYNATVSVSNTNVPVIGQQFAWNYEGAGNPILITSIPAQIIGTAGTISNANPSVGSTTNEFVFGISNTSGSSQVVYWGYVTL